MREKTTLHFIKMPQFFGHCHYSSFVMLFDAFIVINGITYICETFNRRIYCCNGWLDRLDFEIVTSEIFHWNFRHLTRNLPTHWIQYSFSVSLESAPKRSNQWNFLGNFRWFVNFSSKLPKGQHALESQLFIFEIEVALTYSITAFA